MKTTFQLIIYLLLSHFSFAQVITFERTYPFFTTDNDRANQVIQTHDKGYALRTMTDGNVPWDPKVGGVVKLDSMGIKQWEYHFVMPMSTRFDFIAETNDSGIIMALTIPTDTSGVGNYNLLFEKLNNVGQVLWSKVIDAQFWVGHVYNIESLINNNLLVSSYGYGISNLLLLDGSGNLLKWNNYPNINYTTEYFKVNDSLFMASAARDSSNQTGYLSTVLIDDSGKIVANTLWQYDVDSEAVTNGAGWGTINRKGEGFCFGQKKNIIGTWERHFFKFDSTGAMVISRKSNFDYNHLMSWAMSPTFDGGFAMCGAILNNNGTLGSSWMYRFDENGDSLWFKYIANVNNRTAGFNDVVQTSDSGFVAAGGMNLSNRLYPYAVKTDATGQVFNLLAVKNDFVASQELSLFPNPAQTQLNIRCSGYENGSVLEIRDIGGKLMRSESLPNNAQSEQSTQIDVSQLSAGFYFCQILSEGRVVVSKKLVIVD